MIQTATISSPVGFLELQATDKGLCSLKVVSQSTPLSTQIPPILKDAVSQVRGYFDGNRTEFDLIFDFQDKTEFYKQVWNAVSAIPFGKTTSYSDIANALNNPGAVRAVGMANGRNPIPIIIPCHRVVGKNGKLTGYFYGLEMKHKLLAHENPQKYQVQGVLF